MRQQVAKLPPYIRKELSYSLLCWAVRSEAPSHGPVALQGEHPADLIAVVSVAAESSIGKVARPAKAAKREA